MDDGEPRRRAAGLRGDPRRPAGASRVGREIERRYPALLPEIQAGGLAARASLPLRASSGLTLGALGFGWSAEQEFGVAQLRRLDLIAHLTGLALERAITGGTSERRRIEALDEAEHENTRLSLLDELSSTLAGLRTQSEVLERLTRTVIRSQLAEWCTVVRPDGGQLVRVAAAHRDGVLDELAQRLVGGYPHPFDGPSPGVVVYRSARPLRLEHLAAQIIADLDDSAASTAYARTLRLLGDGPGLIVPIFAEEKVTAVLTMVREHGRLYDDEDVALAGEIAARVSAALEDARHVESERELARALQDAALPKALPAPPGLLLAAGYRAASEGVQIGGDWYDALELQDGRVALVVGDVAGHGVNAAALMAQMRNTLRANLFSLLGPAESLARLASLIAHQERDAFATVICVELDPRTGAASWASAGHPAPLLLAPPAPPSISRGLRPRRSAGFTRRRRSRPSCIASTCARASGCFYSPTG